MTARYVPLCVPKTYLLDANVLIAAHRDHYAPDICPGFWECLEHYSHDGRLLSIDRVHKEIESPEELVNWADRMSDTLFTASAEQAVVRVFSEMQQWVQADSQFLPVAKADFASAADGWLAAYAKVYDMVLVTHEMYDPNVRRRVPLPNVCLQFGVNYGNTFDMLRDVGIRLDWIRT